MFLYQSRLEYHRDPVTFAPTPPHICLAEDPITSEPLERTHIVWNNWCYNYSTLQKIAIVNREWREPPAFLEPMSELTRNQITHKFGQDALRIGNDDIRGFRERLQRYQYQTLSHGGDLYVCPICYLMAKQHVIQDPMLVLSHGNDYIGGALMCFKTIQETRQHIIFKHDIENPNAPTIFQRHKIRAADGLVQNFVFVQNRIHGNWAREYWQSKADIFNHIYNLVNRFTTEREQTTFPPDIMTSRQAKKIWSDISHVDDSSSSSSEEEEAVYTNEHTHRQFDNQNVQDEVEDSRRLAELYENREYIVDEDELEGVLVPRKRFYRKWKNDSSSDSSSSDSSSSDSDESTGAKHKRKKKVLDDDSD